MFQVGCWIWFKSLSLKTVADLQLFLAGCQISSKRLWQSVNFIQFITIMFTFPRIWLLLVILHLFLFCFTDIVLLFATLCIVVKYECQSCAHERLLTYNGIPRELKAVVYRQIVYCIKFCEKDPGWLLFMYLLKHAQSTFSIPIINSLCSLDYN